MGPVAILASILVAAQIAAELFFGSTVCLNQGCRIVEQLTRIPSIYINLLGLVFFQAVFWSNQVIPKKENAVPLITRILLSAGLAVEAVLLSYQTFVAHTFCIYCLIIFCFVFALNLLAGGRQLLTGLFVFLAAVGAFSLLNFMPAGSLSQHFSIDQGTYSVRTCDSPSKDIYLVFSADCGHCQRVLEELVGCSSCNVNLNPIDRIETSDIWDGDVRSSYRPEINRILLSFFGIDEIPVLVVKSPDGFRFIQGEKKIINYVRHACFSQEPVLYMDRSMIPQDEGMTLITEDDEDCSINIECTEK